MDVRDLTLKIKADKDALVRVIGITGNGDYCVEFYDDTWNRVQNAPQDLLSPQDVKSYEIYSTLESMWLNRCRRNVVYAIHDKLMEIHRSVMERTAIMISEEGGSVEDFLLLAEHATSELNVVLESVRGGIYDGHEAFLTSIDDAEISDDMKHSAEKAYKEAVAKEASHAPED